MLSQAVLVGRRLSAEFEVGGKEKPPTRRAEGTELP